jgi:hypothetical protein
MKKYYNLLILMTIVLITVLSACNKDLLVAPEAKLQVDVKNSDSLLIPHDTIHAGKTMLFFSNSGTSYFSVVYPGYKVLKDSAKGVDGKDSVVWTTNFDYKDRDKAGYYDTKGKRATKGITMTFNAKNNTFATSGFKYPKPGRFIVYLEAINIDEKGNTKITVTSQTVDVVQ